MDYAIADIHGGSRTFKALLDKIELRHSDRLYLLGDYVDRGPDSRGVLATICDLQGAGFDVRAVRGNHDDMLLRTVRDDHDLFSRYYRAEWGWYTLQSFGVDEPEQIPEIYINLLNAMPYVLANNDYVFVHAGLNMDTAHPACDTNISEMLWNRTQTADRQKLGNRRLVTGHAITTLSEIRDSIHSDNVRLDNGAFTNQQPERGNLVALNLDTKELTIQAWLDGVAID